MNKLNENQLKTFYNQVFNDVAQTLNATGI